MRGRGGDERRRAGAERTRGEDRGVGGEEEKRRRGWRKREGEDG